MNDLEEDKKLDELVEKINMIYADLQKGKTHKYISKKYGVYTLAIPDIKCINDLENLKSNIQELKRMMNEGETIRKISAKFGYGIRFITYIERELECKVNLDAKREKKEEYVKRIEDIWRSYKSGEEIYEISSKHCCSVEEVEIIIRNIDKRIKNQRKKYEQMESFDVEAEKQKLKKIVPFSDDIVDYVLYGTEINLQSKPRESKTRMYMGDDERDE